MSAPSHYKTLKDIVNAPVSKEQMNDYFRLLGSSDDILVSLIIPIYNAMPTLEGHLKSLLLQSTLLPYEVIFVDNNSSDGSKEYLENLEARVISESRQGVNWARQTGLEIAKGEVIISMDPDTVYGPGYIDDMALPFFFKKDLVLTWNSPRSYVDTYQTPITLGLRNWVKNKYKRWNSKRGEFHVIKSVRAHGMAFRTEKGKVYGYNEELPQVPGCDDGIFALTMYSLGNFMFIDTLLWTALVNHKGVSNTLYPWNKKPNG